MLNFLIAILVLLLYAAIAMLILYAIAYFYEKVFGQPVPPRVMQLLYVIVALVFVIYVVEALTSGVGIAPPWRLGVRGP